MTEIWRDIPQWEGKYKVCSLGLYMSVGRTVEYNNGKIIKIKDKILSPHIDSSGYCQYLLRDKEKRQTVSAHRLIAQLFPELVRITNEAKGLPFEKLDVNHIDKNPLNNRADNLEWCTHKYNVTYSQSKPVEQYTKDGILINTFISVQEAARQTGISPSNICSVLKGKRKSAGGYMWVYKEKGT